MIMNNAINDELARDALRDYYMPQEVILAAYFLQESLSFATVLCPTERLVAAKASIEKAIVHQYGTNLSQVPVLGVETRSMKKRRIEEK